MSKAPAVDYAIQIIEFIANQNKEIGIADISNSLGINKNAASRVLSSLLDQNWIYLSNVAQKKYRLSLRAFSVLSKNMNENTMLKIADPFLSEFHDNIGDAVYLGVKNGNNVLYLLHYDSVKEVRINGCVGGEYPLNCSAPGKVLLSFGTENEIEQYFATKSEKRTANTIESFEEFKIEAKKIKEQKYAIDNEEFAKGIICIACPVLDHNGDVVASIGLSSLTIYDDIQSLIEKKYPLLKETAIKISYSLGYSREEKHAEKF